jgi:hypothetical protein
VRNHEGSVLTPKLGGGGKKCACCVGLGSYIGVPLYVFEGEDLNRSETPSNSLREQRKGESLSALTSALG